MSDDAVRPDPTEREGEELYAALDDEHRAHAIDTQVLADFGDVSPFANIADHLPAFRRCVERGGQEQEPGGGGRRRRHRCGGGC
jgi:hypothetical protein